MRIRIFPNDDDLAMGAALHISMCVKRAIRLRGRAMVAFAGGGTPKKTYEVLANPETRGAAKLLQRNDREHLYLFLTDERFVSMDNPNSNFQMLKQTLLVQSWVPAEHVFPVLTTMPSAATAADEYENTIKNVSGEPGRSLPRFDLILLGLGEDGHTASLFPGAPALSVADHWVVAAPPGSHPPSVERITLTLPVLNAAREVMFLVSGRRKAQALRAVLEGGSDPKETPGALVRPVKGALTWFVDEDAMCLVNRADRQKTGTPDSAPQTQGQAQLHGGNSNGT